MQEFAQNLNYGPEPDTISYLIKNGATVKEVQVEMGERLAGQSYPMTMSLPSSSAASIGAIYSGLC